MDNLLHWIPGTLINPMTSECASISEFVRHIGVMKMRYSGGLINLGISQAV